MYGSPWRSVKSKRSERRARQLAPSPRRLRQSNPLGSPTPQPTTLDTAYDRAGSPPKASAVESSRCASICAFRSAIFCSAVAVASAREEAPRLWLLAGNLDEPPASAWPDLPTASRSGSSRTRAVPPNAACSPRSTPRRVRGLLRQTLAPEAARVDDGRVHAESPDLGLQGLHPALQLELRRAVCRAELEAQEARRRRDRDDVARAARPV